MVAKIEKLCKNIRLLIEANPCTRKESYHVYLNNFGISSLEILIIVFWDVANYKLELEERHKLHAQIITLMENEKVRFAYPSQSLYLTQVKNEG